MSIYVHYKVPLVAEVAVETGEVISVHLDDEAIEGPLKATADGVELPPAHRERWGSRSHRCGPGGRLAGERRSR